MELKKLIIKLIWCSSSLSC